MSRPQASDGKTGCVFIVGCRRSGTTWMATLLAQHPELVALQQSGFFLVLNHITHWIQTQRKYGGTVLSSSGEASADLERTSLNELYPLHRFHDLIRPLVCDLYERVAQTASGTTAVVDHQPEHVWLWRDIHAVLPDAKFVHIVRDPRAVFSSYLHSAKSWSNRTTFTADPVLFGEEWVGAVSAGRAISAETDRCVEVRYERLREKGALDLERIYGELELPSDLKQCEAAIEACSIDRMRKSAHGPSAFFRRGEVQGWREELSRRQIETVEYVCADLMDELGYERVNGSFSRPPKPVLRRQRQQRRLTTWRSWIRDGDSWIKRAVRSVARKVPGLRRVAWQVLKW